MPTLRPRYTVTETDELKRSLHEVERQHPELKGDRNALFRRLLAEGMEQYDAARGNRLAQRRAALREIAGKYPGGWPADWREQRDSEWPE